MITEAILTVVFSFFNLLVSFLPSFSMPADMLSSLTQIFAWVAWTNYYIPLDIAVQGFGIVFATWIPAALTHLFISLF